MFLDLDFGGSKDSRVVGATLSSSAPSGSMGADPRVIDGRQNVPSVFISEGTGDSEV